MKRKRALMAAVGAISLLTAASAGAVRTATHAPAATAKTLVSFRGRIGGFAQDGNRIAWLAPRASCHDFVQLRNLRTRKQVRLAAKRGATCPPADGYLEGRLALAGDRTLWGVFDARGANTVVNYTVYVVAGRAGTRDRVVYRFADEVEKDDDGNAPPPDVAMAGDGSTLVFAAVGVRAVLRGRPSLVARLATTALATAAGKIAVARQSGEPGCICNDYPQWSPDGRRLAFASGRDGYDHVGVYTTAATGGPPIRLADGFHPRWSPDGSRIALIRAAGATTTLVVIDGDGAKGRDLGAAYDAAWSPDGTRLAFTREVDTDQGTDVIGVVNADGTGERMLAESARQPSWSPDGTKLAFASAAGVEVIDVDGSNRRALAAGGTEPAWAPDGSKLLVARPDGLHVVSVDGTGDVQVTHPEQFGREADRGASWSPSGSQIVFARYGYNEYGVEVGRRVWIVHADGSGERALTAAGVFASEPAWSPTGEQVTFGAGELYVLGADGTGLTQVTTTRPAEAKSEAIIFSATSRAKRASLTATGDVRALALSPSVAALLVEGSFGKRIELFDPVTGAAHGGVAVDRETAGDLSAAGRRIVFRRGNEISVLDAATKQVSTVAVAAAAPIGLSIEGRRIAWGENLGRRARIRAVAAH